jgi:membrane protein implicated in regulation of membrane protease activity
MGFMITSTTMYIIWAVAIVAFGVLEGMTAQLVSIWFVFGSITGLIAAICGAPIILQVIIFVLVTIITLIATRPIVKKKLNTKVQPTNADRCIGQDGVVIEEINNLAPSGQVKADGKIWTARSFDQSVIPNGTVVTVEKIDGVKLIVKTK